MSSISEYFSAAVRGILDREPRGAQSDLALTLGISPAYLSQLLAGQKRWTEELQLKVAAHFGYGLFDLLETGRFYLERGVFFPYAGRLKDFAAHSPDKARMISILAGQDAGILGAKLVFTAETLPLLVPQVKRYYKREIDSAELYQIVYESVKKALDPSQKIT